MNLLCVLILIYVKYINLYCTVFSYIYWCIIYTDVHILYCSADSTEHEAYVCSQLAESTVEQDVVVENKRTWSSASGGRHS